MSTEPTEMPQGAVVITPTQMYMEMQSIGKKVDHLTSVIDPWQSSISNQINTVREQLSEQRRQCDAETARITARVAELKAEREVEHAKIDNKIETIKAERVTDIGEVKNEIGDVERRVGSLEGWRWFLAGIGAILGPAAGIIAAAVFGG